jgi:uncharacterized membrane protein
VTRSLDRAFRISVTLKGVDGALEIVGGVILLVVSPTSIAALTKTLTLHELSQDPHDFIATNLLHAAGTLTRGSSVFAGVYLLGHGIAKVAVVIGVLREERWAYPTMIALLGAFIAYQLYRIALHVTIGVTLLTLFDAVLVWLTWREYQGRRGAPQP